MSFAHSGGQLHVDGVALADIAAATGTPAYVYSWTDIRSRYQQMDAALADIPHCICYAVKANSNLSVLARLASLGSGFDIVSGGELERVLRAGGEPRRVVFSGVGKTAAEIGFAIKCDIGCFNVESDGELDRIVAQARILGRRARIAVRVNPDVDANTHPYIATGRKESKFGVPPALALDLYRRAAAAPELDVVGVDCHIGSQIADPRPFQAALTALVQMLDALEAEGMVLRHVDIGGGFGISYRDEPLFDLPALGRLAQDVLAGRDIELLVEPGRFLVADAGVLLTRVEYLKPAPGPSYSAYAVVDAAMNDLIRPALYQAWHDVKAVIESDAQPQRWNLVGPVCETGDFLALDRPLAIKAGDLLAIKSAGAYGFVQSSNYNSRPRAAEVVVDGDDFAVARKRETVADLMHLETIV